MTENTHQETEGQLALFDTDLNPTPEAQGFDAEDVAEGGDPLLDCIHCGTPLVAQPSGRLTGADSSISCEESPHKTHEIITSQEQPC